LLRFIYALAQSLETILNLVWTSVSLGLLVACGIHLLREGADRRRAAAAVAVLCLVCLLFPVISATDDINAASPALVETNKLKWLAAWIPAVLTLLDWPALLSPTENRWATIDVIPILAPLSEAFAFQLNRRPPPSLSRAS
jgi:hypothetical protein